MITMQSTEEERYKTLKDRKLTVCMWDSQNPVVLLRPDESISKALLRFAKENNVIGSYICPESFRGKVKINARTIKESISSMVKQQSDLYNLGKLMTILPQVAQSAVLTNVEEYRHINGKNPYVNGVYQYISAFYDQTYLYPVKITIEERSKQQDDNAHMILTVGYIPLAELQKEGTLSIPQWLLHSRENSDSGSMPSFDIMLPQLVKYFNENEAILIKNLPGPMLSQEQRKIKEKLVRFDREKEESKRMERFYNIMIEAAERGESMVYKVVPHEYSEQMRQAMLKSGICFAPLTTDDGYLSIVVQEKDADAFLQIQSTVFEKEINMVCGSNFTLDKSKQEEDKDMGR